VDELNHRVKNTLAIVQSIASQSFRDMSDPKEAQAKFRARLRALAAAHDLLTKGNWANATLSEIIRTSLFACGIMDDGARNVEFSIDTEERLSPKTAVSLSMALHELATNAIKHGALSSGSGQLYVRCSDSTSGPDQILIEWEETHPGVSLKDYRSGFGMKLIRGTVETEMNGDLDLRFTAEGLKCVIVLPRAPLGGQG
jgi:two-component sensor histidine kinase